MQKVRFAVRRSRYPVYFKRSLLQIDGVDARSLAEIKRRRIGYTLSIYFGVATTQMRRIFAKGAGMRAKDSVYYPDGWDKFITSDSKVIQKGSLFS